VAKMPYLDSKKFKSGSVFLAKCTWDCETAAERWLCDDGTRAPSKFFRGLSKDKVDLSEGPGARLKLDWNHRRPPSPAGAVAAPRRASSPRREQRCAAQKRRRDTGGPHLAEETPAPRPAAAASDGNAFSAITKDIVQQTEYFYKVRLIARFTSVDLRKEMSKRRRTGTSFELVHHATAGQEPDAGPCGRSRRRNFYATPPDGCDQRERRRRISSTRLMGINGSPPEIGLRAKSCKSRSKKGFSLNFEVYVWIQDIGEWKSVFAQERRRRPTR